MIDAIVTALAIVGGLTIMCGVSTLAFIAWFGRVWRKPPDYCGTPCDTRKLSLHCDHWYAGHACCACGALGIVNMPVRE